MQKIAIEVSYEDQIFVENTCTKTGLSYSKFFKSLLDNYRKCECSFDGFVKNENINATEDKTVSVDNQQLEGEDQTKKRAGRPAKNK